MKVPHYNPARLRRIPDDALLEICAAMLARHTEGHDELVLELRRRSRDWREARRGVEEHGR